jgi:[ribosomal protein S18]-alanine N-acetyltransferase
VSALRAVSASDSDVLAALHGECFPDDPWGPQAVAEVLAMPGAFGFLAVEPPAETPTGFLLALALPEECEILALGVRRASRRRGVARALVAALLAATNGAGHAVLLEVAEDNEAALGLYGGAGFARVGRRAAYYRRGAAGAVAALQLRRAAAKSRDL